MNETEPRKHFLWLNTTIATVWFTPRFILDIKRPTRVNEGINITFAKKKYKNLW